MLMIGYLNRPKSDFFDDEGFGMTEGCSIKWVFVLDLVKVFVLDLN